MGAKIEFCFLTKEKNYDLLKKLFDILYQNGWFYNQFILGEYTYWIDSPIWKFGKSKTITEEKLYEVNSNYNELINKLLNNISSYFSPSLSLGAKLFNKIITSTISIFENDNNWKEVKIFFDRYEIFDSIEDADKIEVKKILTKLFIDISSEINSYYGIGATEFDGLAASPEKVNNKDFQLGDLNFISEKLLKKIDFDKIGNGYKKIFKENGSCILINQNNLFSLS